MVLFSLESPCKMGDMTTVLVEIEVWDDAQNNHQVRTTVTGRRASFQGTLPPDCTVALLVGVMVTRPLPMLSFAATAETKVFPRHQMPSTGLTQVVELCSGIGCIGHGMTQAGFHVVLRSDISQPMLELSTRLDGVPVSQCDVGSDDILVTICSQVPHAKVLTAGVACQPYSKLGDKRAEQDPRARTFTDVLKVGYLCRFGIMVLECVSEVLTCDWFQQTLKDFCIQSGYHVHQDILHLQHTWVARRSRWWAILTHPAIGTVTWDAMPRASPQPLIAHLLPEFLQCEVPELEQLKLDLYELGRFADAGFENNEIQLQGQMATSLHSCGNSLSSCPCGCRKYPLSEERLMKGGLHGLLVRLGDTVQHRGQTWPNFRHVHPAELSLMNGDFADYDWGPDLRTALCGLGQMASPLQANWLGSHVMQVLAQKFSWETPPTPQKQLSTLMAKLLASRDKIFGKQQTPCMQFFQAMVDQQCFAQPSPFQFRASDPSCPGLVPKEFTGDDNDAAPADSPRNEPPTKLSIKVATKAEAADEVPFATIDPYQDHELSAFLQFH